MTKTFDIAIVGATGLVGETLLSILEERQFPVGKLYALASSRSTHETVLFCGKPVRVQDVAEFDFSQAQLALFSAGSSVSAQYAPVAAQSGCLVIDNTSCFRYEPDVPLVVSEVNPEVLRGYESRGIIANPNCSTMQIMVALKPIYDAVGIERINVATYQAVSGGGRQALMELAEQTTNILNAKAVKVKALPKQIAFNVIPHIDSFEDNGYTREEMKIVWETRKILADDKIQVNATAVRVPVFFGHSAALHIETQTKISAIAARKLLKAAPGIVVVDNISSHKYPTPVTDASGKDAVYVGRIREDISHPCGLNLWVVADNVRKGAALNAVQIAEIMISQYL